MCCHVAFICRAQYETLIRRCFIQLTEGCGDSECTNQNCATGSGQSMDQNQAAAKALTLVHKSDQKKLQICIPQDRVTCSSVMSKKWPLNSLPVTPSASGSSSLGEGESFAELSQTLEPMETTDSLVTANTNKSNSSGSPASSTLIQMHSGTSEALSQATRPVVRIPSDIEPALSSTASGSIDTSTDILSTPSSEGLVANHMPSASTISSSEIVGMDLSPSVPSGPSFSLPPQKDGTFLPVESLSPITIPGMFGRE